MTVIVDAHAGTSVHVDEAETNEPAFVVRHLVLVGGVVAVARWVFAADRRIFHVYLDEPGQFAIARWISGRQDWSLFDLDTWQPGAALLFAPLYWLSDDVSTVVRLAIGVNALVAGASAVALAFVGRRLTTLPPATCCLLAVLVSLVPSALSASSLTWGEPLVTLSFFMTLLALFRYVDQPGTWRAVPAIGAATVGYLTHGRLLSLVVATAAITVGCEVRRRQWRSASSIAVVSLLFFVLSVAFVRVVQAAVWDEPGNENTISSTLRRLGDPGLVGSSLLGQLWYQLAASALLFGFGAAALVARASREWSEHSESEVGRESLVTLAATLPLLAVSVVFMARTGRSDFAIYGRYNDAIVGPILFVGLAIVYRSARMPLRHVARMSIAWLMVFAALTGFVSVRSGDQLRSDAGISEMIAGLLPFQGRAGSVDVIRVAVIAAVAVAVLLAAARLGFERWPSHWLLLTVALLVAAGGVRTHTALRPAVNGFETASRVQMIREIVPPGSTVGFHFVPPDQPSWVLESAQRRAAQLYQAYLPDYRIVRDNGLGDGVGPYVFAPRRDPALTAAGATPLWEAQDSGMVLWREPDIDDR